MELAWEDLQGRDGHAVGRELLAKLYRQATGEPLPVIALTPRGKPYFLEKDWHFSVSHTKTTVFCALSRQNIGIDAERTDRKIDPRLANRCLSPGEQAQVEAAENKNSTLLKFWVMKEAYAKLTGLGIGDYLKSTNFCLENCPICEKNGHFIAILEDEKPCFLTPTPI